MAPGCCPTAPLFTISECVPDGAIADAGPPRACDAPTEVDPATVDSREAFEVAASTLVCDRSLQCPRWALAQSFCHPEFARLFSMRAGLAADAPFDAAAGRACLEALIDAPSCDHGLDVAFRCLDLINGRFGRACDGDAGCDPAERCGAGRCVWRVEGTACTAACGPGLRCADGACAPLVGDCASDADCDPSLVCTAGRCAPARAGAACGPQCADGLVCTGGVGVCAPLTGLGAPCCGQCDVGTCIDGTCAPVGHIGCGCSHDDECPYDVSRCIAGACVARPMLDEPCDPMGAPCFGSICDSGVCRPMRAGEGFCGHDLDCEPGLVCSRDAGSHCARLLAERDECVRGAFDAVCGPDLFCATIGTSSRCRPRPDVGEPCSLATPCVETALCDTAAMVCIAR